MSDIDAKLALVVDLDGTALNDAGNLPNQNRDALNRFVADGGLLIISTGRSRSAALSVLGGVELANGYLTCDNGCNTYRGVGTMFCRLPGIPVSDVESVLEFVKRKPCRINIFTDEHNYAPLRICNLIQCLANTVKYWMGSKSSMAVSERLLREVLSSERVKKVWVRGLPVKYLPVLNDSLIASSAYFINDYGVIEIASDESDKLAAVQQIIDVEKIPLERVYVVGDDGNDLALLRNFPNSFAVANARNEVKAAAKHVVPANIDFGVTEVVEYIDADRRRILSCS